MDLEAVRSYLDKGGDNLGIVDKMPPRLWECFVSQGIHVDHIEPGRVLCSLKVSSQLLNTGNFLHGGVIAMLVDMVGSAPIYSLGVPSSGVSVEINVSYLDASAVDDRIQHLPCKEQLEILLMLSGVLPDIDLSCGSAEVDEIEIEAEVLSLRKEIAVVRVEFRNSSSGKVIAQGRHTKYLPVKSKL